MSYSCLLSSLVWPTLAGKRETHNKVEEKKSETISGPLTSSVHVWLGAVSGGPNYQLGKLAQLDNGRAERAAQRADSYAGGWWQVGQQQQVLCCVCRSRLSYFAHQLAKKDLFRPPTESFYKRKRELASRVWPVELSWQRTWKAWQVGHP